jgi:hypothetical protein
VNVASRRETHGQGWAVVFTAEANGWFKAYDDSDGKVLQITRTTYDLVGATFNCECMGPSE